MASRVRIIQNHQLGGALVVEGTHVPAEDVLSEIRAGRSKTDIYRRYPGLPNDGIEACVEWARAGRPI